MNDTINVGRRERPAVQRDAGPGMDGTTRLGLGILAAGGLLGLLGDALLRATPWGLNVFLWVGSLVLAALALGEWQRFELRGGGRWLVVPLLGFAAALAWRASETLIFLDVLAVLVALALAANRTRAGRLRIAGLTDYAWSATLAALHAMFGALILVGNTIRWRTIPRTRWSGAALAVGRGLIITLPLLFLFGGLFMAADAVFNNIVTDVLDFDLETVFGHLFLWGFWGWLVLGFLRQMLLDTEHEEAWPVARPGFLRLGTIEVGIILGALNVLFLAFVLVQFRYFFGGAALVQASTGLTYAEYARRGFFELVTVAALVLPLLLGTHWLFGAARPIQSRLFVGLAGLLVALLSVVMLSALQRMRLYMNEFGLTELRLYTTAFMGWLALLFGWFGVTVLRGERPRFAFGALAAGFGILALLHLINPDALIVGTNVSRQGASQPFDPYYVTTLSADALPTLVAALPQMQEADRCRVAAQILEDWPLPEASDWRTWNWGRAQAWRTVRANQGTLQTMACPGEDFYPSDSRR